MKLSDTKRYERLIERYGNGDLPRRSFLGLLGASALVTGVVGGPIGRLIRAAHAADVESIRFDGWGGVVSEAFRKEAFAPYQEATGIEVVDGTFGSSDEFFTLVKSSPKGTYNLYHASGVFDYARFVDAGYGVDLNLDNIPNMQYVMDALIEPFREITPDSLSAVPYDYGTTGLAYNRNQLDEARAEEIASDMLLLEEFEGKIGGYDNWRTRIWYGALQTGQDPNDIQDLDAVWDKVREHRELILKYWGSGAELMSLLAEEEIYITEGWSGRIAALQKQGHPIAYLDPKDSYSWMEALFVLDGSPLEPAEELLNFMLEPDVAIAVAVAQNYPPALDPDKVDLPQEVKDLPAFDPTGTLEGYTFAKPAYWNGHETDWAKTYNRVKRGY